MMQNLKVLRIVAAFAVVGIGFGLFLMYRGAQVIQQGRIPLTKHKDLTGLWAQLGGWFFLACGLVVFADGAVFGALAVWRICVLWGQD